MKKLFSMELLGSLMVYTLVFLYTLYPYGDPDWGWHYRYGEYFITHGKLLFSNPYSWTLPDYRWINPSWLYDVVVYGIYTYWGFIGFSIAGAMITLGTFYIITRPTSLHHWQKGILAFFYVQLLSRTIQEGLRSQMFASLFFALVVAVIHWGDSKPKALWTLPFIFLIFANVHGLFTVALAIFGLYVISYAIRAYQTNGFKGLQTRSFLILISLLLISIFTTLINPFGLRLYQETLKHWSSPALNFVYEWDPIATNICAKASGVCSVFWLYSLVVGIIAFVTIVKYKKVLFTYYALAAALLLYLTVGSQRYLVQFTIVTIPFVAVVLADTSGFLTRYKATTWVFFAAAAFLLYQGIAVHLPMLRLEQKGFNRYCELNGCSERATQFLIQNPPKGNGLTYYDWGGYLIGRGVPFRVFVDGRMTVWGQNGESPFIDFINSYFHGDLTAFRKYDFQWVLIPNQSTLADTLLSGNGANRLGTWAIRYYDPMAIYLERTK